MRATARIKLIGLSPAPFGVVLGLRLLRGLFLLFLILVVSTGRALAQTNSYPVIPAGSTFISDSATPCTAPMINTFNVTDSFTVADVNVGVLLSHTYRGDIRMSLKAPDGTIVEFVTGAGTWWYNISVLFDDEAGSSYAADATDHSTTARYQHQFTPQTALSALDGVSAFGTWELQICDQYAGDTGNFIDADLELTVGAPQADLSLSVLASNTTPSAGSNITLTVQVTNGGSATVSGVDVFAQLPSGLSYVSDNGGGAYNPVTGIWTLPSSLALGASASLQITAAASSTGSSSFLAEIQTSPITDPDSTPNNRTTNPNEDDTDSVFINVNGTAGTAPTLSCDVALERLDWSTASWTTGSLTGTNIVAGTPISIGFTGSTGALISDAGFGGQSPLISNVDEGGYGAGTDSLHWLVDYASTSDQIIITIDLGTPGVGVEGLQFEMFDIDRSFATPNFVDQMSAYGYFNGVPVSPASTDGLANDVLTGSTIYGTAGSNPPDADGNLTYTFASPVDQVRLYYEPGPGASANPAPQAVALYDLNFCPRGIDYSDAPSALGSPSHYISKGIRLGAQNPDRENAAAPGANADNDDNTGVPDDEDGVTFPGLARGATATIPVMVNGPGGYLQAWMDFNGNNSFADTGEQIATNVQDSDGDGLINLSVTIPTTATSAQTYARFRWSTTPSLSATGSANDGEVEDYAVTFTGAASLVANKSIAVFDPGALGLYAVPGNDVIYTFTVTNTGSGPADPGSIEIIDKLPAEVTFYNGDIDDAGPELNPVAFSQSSGAGLTFTYATDAAYSNATTKPVNFAACTYTPTAGYDPAVTYICLRPQGSFASGTPDPNFTLSFRARID